MKIVEIDYGEASSEETEILGGSPNAMNRASRNLIPFGVTSLRGFRGLFNHTDTVGRRQMFSFGDTWAALDDVIIGMVVTKGGGSIFRSYFGSGIICGNGQVSFDGDDTAGLFASSLPKIALKVNDAYSLANTFFLGVGESSAPQIFVLSSPGSIVPNITGSLSVQIAWFRTTTFDRSRASEMSATVIPAGTPVGLVIPLAPEGDPATITLVIFATELGSGGEGLTHRLVRPNPYTQLEYLERDIQRNVAGLSVTISTDIVNATSAVFEASDAGKRIAVTSGGAVFPLPTTILEYISPTQVKVSQAATTGSASFTADVISYVNGVDRGILLNYSESNLSDEAAWIDDFPPPPCSHVGELDKVYVYCTGPDTKTGVDTSGGTVLQFSNRNYPGSVNPFWRISVPQSVVDIQNRAGDAYMFVGMSLMVIALQYVESTDDTAPATGTVILRGQGILTPYNWCFGGHGLYLFTQRGTVRITEGGAIDTSFFAKFTYLTRTWDQRKTVLSYDPNTQSVVYAHEGISLLYNEETGHTSCRLYLSDYAEGNMISSATTATELLVTMEVGEDLTSVRSLFTFDQGNSSFVAGITDYFAPAPESAKMLNAIYALFHADTTSSKAYFILQRNYQPQFVTDGAMVAHSAHFATDQVTFTSAHVGYYLLVKPTGADEFLARITSIVGPHEVILGTPEYDITLAHAFPAAADMSDSYAILAYYIAQKDVTDVGLQEIVNQSFYLPGCYGVACGIAFTTDGSIGTPTMAYVDAEVDAYFSGKIVP